jgi:hypothetical protein
VDFESRVLDSSLVQTTFTCCTIGDRLIAGCMFYGAFVGFIYFCRGILSVSVYVFFVLLLLSFALSLMICLKSDDSCCSNFGCSNYCPSNQVIVVVNVTTVR